MITVDERITELLADAPPLATSQITGLARVVAGARADLRTQHHTSPHAAARQVREAA